MTIRQEIVLLRSDYLGLFDVDEDKIKASYHMAWIECNRGFVDPHRYPYLDFCKDG